MSRIFPLLFAAALLASCASTPLPLPADSPASPEAAEGARPARHTSLRADDSTLKSRAMLAAAAKEQAQWDEHGPVSGTPNEKPGMDHDKIKGVKP